MLVQLQQHTDAWLAWREGGIGGSDASAIMYENEYTSPYALWARKVGLRPPKKMNAAMRRGLDLEDKGRLEFCQKIGEFLPATCMQHDQYTHMLSSLDGRAPDGTIAFELKIPETAHTHLLAREGTVPRIYYAQCQHNLFVSRAKELYFVSYYPKDAQMPLAEVRVVADEAYLAELIPAEQEFWRWVQEKTFPFPAKKGSARDTETNLATDPVWIERAGALWEARGMAAVANDRVTSIEAEMKRMAMRAGTNKVRGAGVVASWVHLNERTQTMPETAYMRIGHSASEEGE